MGSNLPCPLEVPTSGQPCRQWTGRGWLRLVLDQPSHTPSKSPLSDLQCLKVHPPSIFNLRCLLKRRELRIIKNEMKSLLRKTRRAFDDHGDHWKWGGVDAVAGGRVVSEGTMAQVTDTEHWGHNLLPIKSEPALGPGKSPVFSSKSKAFIFLFTKDNHLG